MGFRDLIDRGARAVLRANNTESRALTEPIYRVGNFRHGIVATEQQPTSDRLLTEGFRSTQATAARAVAGRLSDLELVMQRRVTREDGTKQWSDEPDHPFVEVLNKPNRLLSRRQMLKLTSYWLTQTGEAFWLVVTNGIGSTREFWPMSPRHIEKLSDETSPVSGFVFHGEAGETFYSLEEVVWIFDPDPADPFAGVGVVGPQATGFDANTFGEQTMRSHYQNDGTPKIVLKGGETAVAPDEEQKDRFYADWQNRYNRRGGEHVGVPAFIPTDWDIRELSGEGKGVADDVAVLEFLQTQFFMANGVPRSIVGDVVDANRAAADTNRLVFDRHTIKPQTGLIADALTDQVVALEFGPDWRVAFEDFIDEDSDLRLREEQQDLTLKVRTVNQVRADRGLDPVDWGDVPVGSFGDQPYEPDEGIDLDEDGDDPTGGKATESGGETDESTPNGENVPEDDGASRARLPGVTPRMAAAFTPESTWSRIMQREAEFVPRMVSAQRRVFGTQKQLTLEALVAQGNLAATNERAYSRVDWIDELFDTDDFKRLFDVLITPITLEVYERAGENVLAELGQRPSLDFDDRAQKELRENGAQLVQLANATTKRNIRNTLAKGIADGDSIDQLEKRVRRVFNQASRGRARTIARTEVGHAISKGQLAGYQTSNIVTLKRWNTAFDPDVRDSHQIDGQTVRVDEVFTLGDGEQAQAPRIARDGGRLSARNSINCRCFTTPVLEGV